MDGVRALLPGHGMAAMAPSLPRTEAARRAGEARHDRGRATSLSGVPGDSEAERAASAPKSKSASHQVAFRVSEWEWAEGGGAAGHAGSRRRISAPGPAAVAPGAAVGEGA
ncbi:hypothetical protein IscW_ISCW023218 [Ixodes scapularis]|uniref:Uncharacterized protein n=1 Tax=Ixodes scapularis TaxID=6945 RepID=B7QJA1_IXOSC|nr:hypothetical protein IscW_ISCW023218 [Ixodes scapularis]|eukprot:XP_002415258.1 hypothetical protein IscW_ISCW023218 [Ixodes scapularis]